MNLGLTTMSERARRLYPNGMPGLIDPDWVKCLNCGESFSSIVIENGTCWECRKKAKDELARAREDRRWDELQENPSSLLWQLPMVLRGVAEIDLPDGFTIDEKHWSVTIQGPNGRGKSWLAARATIDWQLRERSEDLLWINCATVAPKLRDFEDSSSKLLNEMLETRLLILDDLGAIRQTEFLAEQIRIVICHRYDYIAKTIVTTDLPLSKFEKRIESRLRSGFVYGMKGKDLRLK